MCYRRVDEESMVKYYGGVANGGAGMEAMVGAHQRFGGALPVSSLASRHVHRASRTRIDLY